MSTGRTEGELREDIEQTRQQLGIEALSISGQQQQAILTLLH